MTITEYLRRRLHETFRLFEPPAPVAPDETAETIRETEWSQEFESLMRARLVMGRFRYGPIERVSDKNYDRIGSLRYRLQIYESTGNTELLVDIANLCMLEYVHGDHPLKHFDSVDDGEHVERT